jgi:DNA recombination protein RmuC
MDLNFGLGIVFGGLAASVGLGIWWQKRLLSVQTALTDKQARLEQAEARLAEASEWQRSNVELQSRVAALTVERDQQAEWKEQLETKWQSQFEAFMLKQLEASRGQTQVETKERQQQFEEKLQGLLKPLNEAMAGYREEIAKMDRHHLETSTTLKTQIAALCRTSQRLTETLTHNKGRGDWGELELIGLLNDAGLIEGIHYQTQVALTNGTSRLRPDICIQLPNQRCVLVDAKTLQMTLSPEPEQLAHQENMLDAMEQAITTQTDDKALAARLARSIREAVKSLGTKAYQSQMDNAADFVVLYAPREWMISLALSSEPGLFEEAYKKNVVLCGPLNLIGLLKIVHLGWSRHQLSENAQQVLTMGQEMHKRAVNVVDKLSTVDKHLAKLNDSVQDTWTALKGPQGLTKQIAKLESYGCKSAKSLPASVMQLELDEPGFLETDPVTTSV